MTLRAPRCPPCGNDRDPHPPHRFPLWSADTGERGWCDGWSAAEADLTAMIRDVQAAISDYELTNMERRPLRLEIHPATHRAMIRHFTDPGPDRDQLLGSTDTGTLFGVPVVLSAGPEPGGWRLIEPGPLLAAGTVRFDQDRPPPARGPAADMVIVDERAGTHRRLALLGPCERCGSARAVRAVGSAGTGEPGSGGVCDELWCPACGHPGARYQPGSLTDPQDDAQRYALYWAARIGKHVEVLLAQGDLQPGDQVDRDGGYARRAPLGAPAGEGAPIALHEAYGTVLAAARSGELVPVAPHAPARQPPGGWTRGHP